MAKPSDRHSSLKNLQWYNRPLLAPLPVDTHKAINAEWTEDKEVELTWTDLARVMTEAAENTVGRGPLPA
eukprot:9695506-Heterocapsa_arctica.AAC.1